MRTRRGGVSRSTILVAGLALLLAHGFSSTAAEARPSCAAEDSRTVASSSKVRVYVGADEGYAVCNRASDRRRRLDSDSTGFAAFRITGEKVAFEQTFTSSSGGLVSVRVLDTRDRRYEHVIPQRYDIRSATPPAPGSAIESVTDLVLPADGRAVWIAKSLTAVECEEDGFRECRVEASYQVRQATSRGRFRVLDSGPGLSPRSLELRSRRASWLEDGRRVGRRVG